MIGMDVERSGVFRVDLPARGPWTRFAATLLRPPLELLLGLTWMAEQYRSVPTGLSAPEFIDWSLDLLGVRVQVEGSDLSRIPDRGPLVVVGGSRNRGRGRRRARRHR